MLSATPTLASARTGIASTSDLPLLLEGSHLYVAANRGPVHYNIRNNGLVPKPAAGGLVTALSGVAGHVPMTWIATASSPGDRLVAGRSTQKDARPGTPRLRYVVASEECLDWFYRRFSNPILWFLQHGLWDQLRRPDLSEMVKNGWMLGYRPINEAFAQTIALEIRGASRPLVLTHDYHFYLLPALLRRRSPKALLQHFVHIPWPNPDAWEVLMPAIRREICKGLLGADIVGFQTEAAVYNFLRCCERFVPGSQVDFKRKLVRFENRVTRIRSYPISIDTVALRELAASDQVRRYKESLRTLNGVKTVVRVDRLDPSKNIALGFRAFGLLLERRPDLAGRVRFLAFLVPSRSNIAEYRRYAQEVWCEVDAINTRFGRENWKPIELFHEDNRPQAIAGMALADVLLVNPLADGMNLVAKEGPIVSERDSALVLSRECGAYVQLGSSAITIPPRDLESTASALERALEMHPVERKQRLMGLRAAIESQNLSWWIQMQLEDLLSL